MVTISFGGVRAATEACGAGVGVWLCRAIAGTAAPTSETAARAARAVRDRDMSLLRRQAWGSSGPGLQQRDSYGPGRFSARAWPAAGPVDGPARRSGRRRSRR